MATANWWHVLSRGIKPAYEVGKKQAYAATRTMSLYLGETLYGIEPDNLLSDEIAGVLTIKRAFNDGQETHIALDSITRISFY